jgi:hypothetical protein
MRRTSLITIFVFVAGLGIGYFARAWKCHGCFAMPSIPEENTWL